MLKPPEIPCWNYEISNYEGSLFLLHSFTACMREPFSETLSGVSVKLPHSILTTSITILSSLYNLHHFSHRLWIWPHFKLLNHFGIFFLFLASNVKWIGVYGLLDVDHYSKWVIWSTMMKPTLTKHICYQ